MTISRTVLALTMHIAAKHTSLTTDESCLHDTQRAFYILRVAGMMINKPTSLHSIVAQCTMCIQQTEPAAELNASSQQPLSY